MHKFRKFQKYILNWYRKNNRDYLPWRVTKTRAVSPYEIFISEIMLQQTQVARVLEKYPQFLKAFPTIKHLANAPLEKILRVWQGMGYNRRARCLKEAAQEICLRHNGRVPDDVYMLRSLLGVGPYTAGAIACFAYNKPTVFLDTNIRKVLIHYFSRPQNCYNKFCHGKIYAALSHSKKMRNVDKIVDKIDGDDLLSIAKKALYIRNPRRWHYALMDYGAVVLAKEKGLLKRVKNYHKQSRFEGSTRYWRSQIVKYLLQYNQASGEELQALVSGETRYNPKGAIPGEIQPLLSSLERDGLVEAASPGLYRISP